MKTTLTNRPVEQVIAAINALDLESVKVRAMDPELGEGWTREYAEGIERGYRTYLAMLAKYLHHAPHIGKVTSADKEKRIALAEKTRRLYEREFGDEQVYSAAWTGIPVRAENVAMSGAAIRAENAAMSGAAIRMENAAMSGAAIRAESAAMSGAAIRAENAAMSGAAIRANNPAQGISMA